MESLLKGEEGWGIEKSIIEQNRIRMYLKESQTNGNRLQDRKKDCDGVQTKLKQLHCI